MSTPKTHTSMMALHLDRGRAIPMRLRRDEEFDVAERFAAAAKSGTDLAAAAERVRDAHRLMKLAREHAANLVHLPVTEDDPKEAA